jgi:hypothetical protein
MTCVELARQEPLNQVYTTARPIVRIIAKQPAAPTMEAALRFLKALSLVLAPVLLAVALYSPPDFSPAPMLPEYSYGPVASASQHEARVLTASERVGEGQLPGPEDLAYDAAGGWLYTGCSDGWVRRVSVPGGDVEDWVHTGGRPLGVVLGTDGELVVADADIVRPLL